MINSNGQTQTLLIPPKKSAKCHNLCSVGLKNTLLFYHQYPTLAELVVCYTAIQKVMAS